MRQPLFKIWGHALGRYVLTRPPIAVPHGGDARRGGGVARRGRDQRRPAPPRPGAALGARGARRAASASSSPPTPTPSSALRQPALGGGHGPPRVAHRASDVLNTPPADEFRDGGAAVSARAPLPRIFLLSPASTGGERAQLVLHARRAVRAGAARCARPRGRAAGRGVHVPQRPLLPRQARATRARSRAPPAGVPGIWSSRPSDGLAAPRAR